MLRFVLSFLCVFGISGGVFGQNDADPTTPGLEPLGGRYIGYYSPSATDQSMYPALHPDSTYRYIARFGGAIRTYMIALIHERGKASGPIYAYRILGNGQHDLHYSTDSDFRIRARANASSSTRIRERFWYLFPVRGGRWADCSSPYNVVRSLKLFDVQKSAGLEIPRSRVYLGVDFHPYYEDHGYISTARIVGLIDPGDEHVAWNPARHDDPNDCGWPLPPSLELEREEYRLPPLDLPVRGAGEPADTSQDGWVWRTER